MLFLTARAQENKEEHVCRSLIHMDESTQFIMKVAPALSAVHVVITALMVYVAVVPVMVIDDRTASAKKLSDGEAQKLRTMRALSILATLIVGGLSLFHAYTLGRMMTLRSVSIAAPSAYSAVMGDNANTMKQVDILFRQAGANAGLVSAISVATIVIGWVALSTENKDTYKEEWYAADKRQLIGSTVIGALIFVYCAATLFVTSRYKQLMTMRLTSFTRSN